jgi:uncharacterized protein YjbI with pentapeptide repeats
MAKKKGPAAAADGVDLATFREQTFCVIGKFAGWQIDEQIKKLVALRGGKVVKGVDARLNYLVIGRTGFAAAKKQAEKLNSQGQAQIQIIDEAAFFPLVAPTRDEAIALLTGGPKAISVLDRMLTPCREYLPDLTGADLRKLHIPDDNSFTELDQLTLNGADLRGAHLAGVDLGSLVGANLDKAHFQQCVAESFDNGTIRKAFCRAAEFREVSGADFSHSDLSHAKIGEGTGAKFVRSMLVDADLEHSKLKQADFTNACLTGADFTDSECLNAKFSQADLRGATLTRAVLRQADFSGADLREADLTAADLRGATFRGAKLAGACLQLAQVDASALDEAKDMSSRTVDLRSRVGPNLSELQQIGQKAGNLTVDVIFREEKRETRIQVRTWPDWTNATWNEWSEVEKGDKFQSRYNRSLASVMISLAHRFRNAAFEFDALTVKSTKSKVSGKALRQIVLEAWCEACGIPVPDDRAAKSQKQSRQAHLNAVREELLKLLRNGKAGVARWNDLSDGERAQAGPFREVDLSRAKLSGVVLRDLDFRKALFSKANLSKLSCWNADFRETSLTDARLDGADAQYTKFQNACLDGASCKGAKLSNSNFGLANLRNANLTKANLQRANLRGADLTDAILDGANLEGATYDEATRWPAGFTDFSNLKWAGQGPNPALAQAKQQRAAGGPIDLPTFLKRLEEEVDPARLQKALSMLKADRFRLFADVQPDSVVGVVKSQTDPDLVYSCRLASDGTFACCTQNLNICGGLRGALCKHLLVLLIGLTRAEQLDPATVDQWIAASRLQKPLLQKELMSETFLRYKGAEAGEIDWRPTETIPEDYYAV